MKKLKLYVSIFVKGMLAGICIAIDGFLYIKARESTALVIVPAFLFSIGLILICNFGFFLYTGKICYLVDEIIAKRGIKYSIQLVLGLVGNYLGAIFIGFVLNKTLGSFNIVKTMVDTKLNYEWWKLIILGIFCGMLIYFAVEGFAKINNKIGKYIVLMLCVAGFIICGFEHCVADMFYFALSGVYSGKSIIVILLIIIGNSIGGLFVPLIRSVLYE